MALSRRTRLTVVPAKRRMRIAAIVIVVLLVESSVLRRRGYGMAGNAVVRCRQDHLFTTIWIPAASLKSIRLGWWRFQHCPVGHHWSLVTPVRRSDLTEDELRAAREHRDIRVP
jgi:hypothetical protein